MVLFGGDAILPGSTTPPFRVFGDTWEFDGSTWTQMTPPVSPPALDAAAMAYDSARGVSVLFGGQTLFNGPEDATWEWDGSTWTRRQLATAPPAQSGAAMAYDSARGVIVLFSGGFNGLSPQTWEYDGSGWVQRFPATSPPGRFFHAMSYDPVRRVTVMFGGFEPNVGRVNDTWEWDGSNWTQRSPAPPSLYPRLAASLVFDVSLQRTVLFGGDHLRLFALGPINDTWEWDGAQWTQNWTRAAPSGRLGQAVVYDSVRLRSVMFGGLAFGPQQGINTTFDFPNDTWELGRGFVTPPGNPVLSLDGQSSFPDTPVGMTGDVAVVRLASSGTGPVRVLSMSVSGDFSVVRIDCPPANRPLASGMFCTVVVAFTPTAAGARQGDLVIRSTGTPASLDVQLSGVGIP